MSSTEHGRQVVRKSGASSVAAPDRRVRRTRKLLHDAFLALVIEKRYEKTTIQDILDRADVGRSTFYVHFRDKEALLMAMLMPLRCHANRGVDNGHISSHTTDVTGGHIADRPRGEREFQ
jgi:Bacterial regulatory proteins, tetR family